MRLLIAVAAVVAIGCATSTIPYADIEKVCDDAHGAGSPNYDSCVGALVAAYQPQNQPAPYQSPQYQQPQYPSNVDSGRSEQQIRNIYRQERMREQTLQHGAGGCTPNFSTGGCL